jgi:hypothetical protein
MVSTIKNITNYTMFFGFIPPHGKKLAPGQEAQVYGSIWDMWNAWRGTQKRQWDSFCNCLAQGIIALVRTPKDHFWDSGDGDVNILDVHSNAVAVINPCWGAYTSL